MFHNLNTFSFETFIAEYASEEWVTLIKNYIKIIVFKKNERIITEGCKVDGYYFINSGKVKIVTSYNVNSERILRFSHEGDIMGHRAIACENFPISAIALTDGEATFIPIDIFMKFVKANPKFAVFLIEFMARELHESEERMKIIIHSEVIVRIAYIICWLIDVYGYNLKISQQLNYTLSRSDMASFAGTTYESIIRNLSKLEELGFIKLEGKKISVLQEIELRELVKTINRSLV